MRLRNLLYSLSIFACSMAISTASPLKSDESVLFIPDIAYQLDKRQIAVVVQAWVYEKERGLGLTTALTKYLGIDKDQLSPEQINRLYARTQLFRVDSERNKQLYIQLADASIHALPLTQASGRSTAIIKLSTQSRSINNKLINYKLYSSGTPADFNDGTSIFVPSEGVSVISDIDDTIKESNVADKKQLLVNTFVNEYKPVKGMSDWYNYLAETHPNLAFHYVSSSPIQLYPALKDFMDAYKFPLGSIHLREATSWNTVIPGEDDSMTHKNNHIEKLLHQFPQRKFILVGDSGEADPEIYANIMRRYPNQILFIAIRDVTQESSKANRYQRTFNGLDTDKWTVFKETLPNVSF